MQPQIGVAIRPGLNAFDKLTELCAHVAIYGVPKKVRHATGWSVSRPLDDVQCTQVRGDRKRGSENDERMARMRGSKNADHPIWPPKCTSYDPFNSLILEQRSLKASAQMCNNRSHSSALIERTQTVPKTRQQTSLSSFHKNIHRKTGHKNILQQTSDKHCIRFSSTFCAY